MKAIEIEITVLPDGSIQLPLHPELRPGTHRAVLVIEDAVAPSSANAPLALKMLELPAWPADARFSREELYDDDRR
jgi:hypothetical protein